MKEPVRLEISLNGPWSRIGQPNIPVTDGLQLRKRLRRNTSATRLIS